MIQRRVLEVLFFKLKICLLLRPCRLKEAEEMLLEMPLTVFSDISMFNSLAEDMREDGLDMASITGSDSTLKSCRE